MHRRLVALALVLLACALPVSAVQAQGGPPIRSFGQLIDAINHTGDATAALQRFIPNEPIAPPALIDATGLLNGGDVHALSNAIARQQGAIALLQGALGRLSVAGGVCSGEFCGSMPLGGYLATQNIPLDRVIAVAIPGNPVTPSDLTLTIVYLPRTSSGG